MEIIIITIASCTLLTGIFFVLWLNKRIKQMDRMLSKINNLTSKMNTMEEDCLLKRFEEDVYTGDLSIQLLQGLALEIIRSKKGFIDTTSSVKKLSEKYGVTQEKLINTAAQYFISRIANINPEMLEEGDHFPIAEKDYPSWVKTIKVTIKDCFEEKEFVFGLYSGKDWRKLRKDTQKTLFKGNNLDEESLERMEALCSSAIINGNYAIILFFGECPTEATIFHEVYHLVDTLCIYTGLRRYPTRWCHETRTELYCESVDSVKMEIMKSF